MKKLSINQIDIIFQRIISKLRFELGDNSEFRSENSYYRENPGDKRTNFSGTSSDEIKSTRQY